MKIEKRRCDSPGNVAFSSRATRLFCARNAFEDADRETGKIRASLGPLPLF